MVSRSKRRQLARSRQAQNSSTVVAAASLPASARRPNRRRARPSQGGISINGISNRSGAVTSSGADVIYTASVADTTDIGDVIWQQQLCPASLKGTRFHSESKLWARWRPVSLSIRIVGAGSTATGGAIMVSWTPDSDFALPSKSFTNVNVAAALERSVVIRLDSRGGINIPSDTRTRWYDTADTGATCSHGRYQVIVVSPPTGFKGKISLLTELAWRVQFEGRRITDLVVGPHSITPNEHPIFTTSDSSFNSKILTFKSKSGGSATNFNGALPGVIYRIFHGTNVPYVKADNTIGSASIFSRALGHPGRILVLHRTTQEAVAYQKTGDERYCITYTAAGDYVTPSVPIFLSDPDYLDRPKYESSSCTVIPEPDLESFEDLSI